MMVFKRIQLFAFAGIIAFTALFIMLELFGTAAPAAAGDQEQVAARAEDFAPSVKPTPEINVIIVYTDPLDYAPVEVLDLSGNLIGEGRHYGEVKCSGENCSKRTTLVLDGVEYEYKYSTRQTFDPEELRAVVQGTGTLTSDRQKERFSFTATFQDNRDGSINTTYAASRPDASFSIPRAPGRFEIGR